MAGRSHYAAAAAAADATLYKCAVPCMRVELVEGVGLWTEYGDWDSYLPRGSLFTGADAKGLEGTTL